MCDNWLEYLLESEKFKDHTIKVYPDETSDLDSPLEYTGWTVATVKNYGNKEITGDFDILLEFLDWDDRYSTYINGVYHDWDDIMYDIENGYLTRDISQALFNKYVLPQLACILPVYKYEHSGIALSTGAFSCMWDSGQIGHIYLTKKDYYKQWNKKLLTKKAAEELKKAAEEFIPILGQFYNGDVYRFEIEDATNDVIESCGGFYSIEDAILMAKDSI